MTDMESMEINGQLSFIASKRHLSGQGFSILTCNDISNVSFICVNATICGSEIFITDSSWKLSYVGGDGFCDGIIDGDVEGYSVGDCVPTFLHTLPAGLSQIIELLE